MPLDGGSDERALVRTGQVGLRLVVEGGVDGRLGAAGRLGAGRRARRMPSRLGRHGVPRGHRIAEPVLLLGEGGRPDREAERSPQEVLGPGVLVEAADQVGDGGGEVVAGGDRRVEQDRAHVLDDRQGLGVGHPLQHLDIDLGAHAARGGHLQRPGEVEQVVAGDPDPDGVGVLRAHRGVDQALPRRVDVGLGPVGCRRPAVELALGGLHRQVGALHDPDLDRRPALLAPGARPGQESCEDRMALGQVGLQHDPGGHLGELRLGEHEGEHVDGQGEVAVLLHVEIDERVRRGRQGRAVEPSQPLGDSLHRALVIVGAQLCRDRRDLHRDIGDLRAAEHLDDPVEAVGRLLLAEHGLAEHVDVEPRSFGRALGQVLAQGCRLGGQDDPGRGLPDLPVHEPHRGNGGQRRELGERPQPHMIAHSEGVAVRRLGSRAQGRCGACRVGDPHHLVGQRHRDRKAGRVPEQPGEPSAVRLLTARAVSLRGRDPPGRAGDRALDHGVGVGAGDERLFGCGVHGAIVVLVARGLNAGGQGCAEAARAGRSRRRDLPWHHAIRPKCRCSHASPASGQPAAQEASSARVRRGRRPPRRGSEPLECRDRHADRTGRAPGQRDARAVRPARPRASRSGHR